MEKIVDYGYLKELTKDATFPLSGTNADGDNIIIEEGSSDNIHYYRVETYQKNDWVRINYYYENGEIEETFDK